MAGCRVPRDTTTEDALSNGTSTVVQRRRLRTDLRRARLEVGLTQEQVAAEMDWSLSKVIRIETGAVSISTNDLKALLRIYHVTEKDRVDELISLAKAARQQSWWSKYRGSVPRSYLQFIEYEESASVIREYESFVIPGLLQSEQYADTILRKYRADIPLPVIKTRLEIRMARQQLLARPKAPQLYFLIDESAICRLLGETDVRNEQVAQLIAMARRPGITIEIVPFSAGLHIGLGDNFTMLEFSDAADTDVLYFEGFRETTFSHDEAEDLLVYREIFESLRSISLGRKGTLEYLTKISGELT
jgi:transcriptional regulator with XRE-family HTH domain